MWTEVTLSQQIPYSSLVLEEERKHVFLRKNSANCVVEARTGITAEHCRFPVVSELSLEPLEAVYEGFFLVTLRESVTYRHVSPTLTIVEHQVQEEAPLRVRREAQLSV